MFSAPAGGENTYWLTRFLFLRGLGLVYFVAFLSLAHQLLPLLGSEGLTPASLYLELRSSGNPNLFSAFLELPSLFWLDASDGFLLATCWLGVGLSLVVALGYANALLMGLLWFLYLSFVHVGQRWYGFGWEFMLLEAGFLAAFLCPLLDGRPFPKRAPPLVVIWLLRWFCFRVLLGAGLIKLRGDPCWTDLTCLVYHFETQPVPHPLSWTFHNLPAWVHTGGTAFNHVVEVVAPFFLFGPRRARYAAGVLVLLFQGVLIASGNLAFVNHLTAVSILVCFDDAVLARLFPARLRGAFERAREAALPSRPQAWAVAGLALTVAVLSVAPIRNLLSPQQIMNTSFDRLHLVNTYGFFGGVGRHRNEVVFSGTRDRVVDAKTVWIEYEWKCKPGDPMRRPCFITPYHYRLDWLVWFAAMSDYDRHPWLLHLVWKLLQGDEGTLSLLAENPFPGQPPRFVRADLYRYRFTDPSDESGAWWKRHRIKSYLAPLSTEHPRFREFLRLRGWIE